MALPDIFSVAGSAMSAQSQRLNVVASNLANADTPAGPNGTVYRAKQVVFESQPTPGNPGSTGVSVSRVVEDTQPPKRVYEPQHPLADADGYVNMPNVNPVDEMVNMISASRSYQSNVEVLSTAKTLMLKLLTLGN
jgi:flagellar basal-body rod protein FlgC